MHKHLTTLWIGTMLTMSIVIPTTASAQFVPVIDQGVISALQTSNASLNRINQELSRFHSNFNRFSSNFDRYADNFNRSINSDTDSVRNLIAAGNPQGRAIEQCNRTTFIAQAYTEGPWASSSASSGIPSEIETTVNNSASLRCLLQDLVEWQKLDLSIQLHAMLKTYIADAQSKQLNNQLMNKVSAASLNWAKAGNQVTNNGVVTNEAVYLTNPSASADNIKQRQLDHFTAQASADPASASAVGSLALCQPWRLDATADAVRNSQPLVSDPFSSTQTATGCQLPSGGTEFGAFSESFNDPAGGGITTFISALSNPANSPLGASSVAAQQARDRILRQEETTRAKFANSGARPVTECSGLPQDPYCLDQQYGTDVTPAFQTGAKVEHAAGQGDRQVEAGNTLDGTAGISAEQQSIALNTAPGGLLGYDETPLATSQTAVTQLVREFYDVIDIGYYGIQEDTIKWAQSTMLMIYDEMKFDPVQPQVVVTQGQAPVDTGY
jgi:hypothetical protein